MLGWITLLNSSRQTIENFIIHLNLKTMLTFQEYHERNPRIYEEFKRFAFLLINNGHKKIGSKQVFERIRWESMIERIDRYKVNNNYTADYAYKFESDFPYLEGIFYHRARRIKN